MSKTTIINPTPFNPSSFTVQIGEPYSILNNYVLSVTNPNSSVFTTDMYMGANTKYPISNNVRHNDNLYIDFMIDERWESFNAIKNWSYKLKDPDKPNADINERTDIYVYILDSFKTEVVGKYAYYECYPEMIPSTVFTFSTGTSRGEAMSVPFKYGYSVYIHGKDPIPRNFGNLS